MAEFTIDDVIKAAEKNGFEWNRNGSYYTTNKDGYITSACVIGQAALNLDVDPEEMLMNIARIDAGGYAFSMSSIWIYNDRDATDYEDALRVLKKILEPVRDRKFKAKRLNRKRVIRKAGA